MCLGVTAYRRAGLRGFGTRVRVSLVFGQLADGATEKEICAEYDLTALPR
jgi:hypothetical protein